MADSYVEPDGIETNELRVAELWNHCPHPMLRCDYHNCGFYLNCDVFLCKCPSIHVFCQAHSPWEFGKPQVEGGNYICPACSREITHEDIHNFSWTLNMRGHGCNLVGVPPLDGVDCLDMCLKVWMRQGLDKIKIDRANWQDEMTKIKEEVAEIEEGTHRILVAADAVNAIVKNRMNESKSVRLRAESYVQQSKEFMEFIEADNKEMEVMRAEMARLEAEAERDEAELAAEETVGLTIKRRKEAMDKFIASIDKNGNVIRPLKQIQGAGQHEQGQQSEEGQYGQQEQQEQSLLQERPDQDLRLELENRRRAIEQRELDSRQLQLPRQGQIQHDLQLPELRLGDPAFQPRRPRQDLEVLPYRQPRDQALTEHRQRQDPQLQLRHHRQDPESQERRQPQDLELREYRQRQDPEPQERRQRQDLDLHLREYRQRQDLELREYRQRQDLEFREYCQRQDPEPQERRQRQDPEPQERRQRQDPEPQERRQRQDPEPQERRQRQDLDLREHRQRQDPGFQERRCLQDPVLQHRERQGQEHQEHRQRQDLLQDQQHRRRQAPELQHDLQRQDLEHQRRIPERQDDHRRRPPEYPGRPQRQDPVRQDPERQQHRFEGMQLQLQRQRREPLLPELRQRPQQALALLHGSGDLHGDMDTEVDFGTGLSDIRSGLSSQLPACFRRF